MNGLLFIRHAVTDMAGAFCGHADPPINALGAEQIGGLIASLDAASVDAVYSSDLQRAVSTAHAIAQARSAPLILRSSLREIGFGEWEGLRWSEIERRDPVYARRWVAAFPHLPAPGGESFASFEARVLREVDALLVLAQHRRIAVVTQGGVMRAVLRSLLGCTEEETWQRTSDYCCRFTLPANAVTQPTTRQAILKSAPCEGERP
jgi:broad specificity phosphatase PhoE